MTPGTSSADVADADGHDDAPGATVVLRSVWTQVIGWAWIAAGVIWALGVVAVAVSERRLPYDTLVVPVLLAVGWMIRRSRLVLHDDGIDLVDGWRFHRVLWAAVEQVTVDMTTRFDAPVTLQLAGREAPLRVQASWGLSMRQRAVLENALETHAAEHDVAVTLRTRDA